MGTLTDLLLIWSSLFGINFPAEVLNKYNHIDIVVSYYPVEERLTAYKVFYCESKYDMNQVGSLGERGVTQILPSTANNYPVTKVIDGWWTSPHIVGAVSYDIYLQQGWLAWRGCL